MPARTTDEAASVASSLHRPLLVGELGGNMCFGFDLTNSPAQIERRTDTERPMVLVSSSGTQLILNAAETRDAVYIACLRNYTAVARHLAERHRRVAIIGAGTRGQFRREDQIGCALVGQGLMALGFGTDDQNTLEIVQRWRNVSLDIIREGRSADYLRRSGQVEDLEFVLSHIDDVETVPWLVTGEFVDASQEVTMGAGAARPHNSSWETETLQ
jgi:2-phosphosulfolactate phosphatase